VPGHDYLWDQLMPRASYESVKDIDAMETALRESLAKCRSYSFSRGWWEWDRFPDVPQADEARAWLERIWKDFSEFGDWKEWTYYPYGPIFLHGMVHFAAEMGKFETEREFLYAVGRRCLGFVHGGGVRGNPNAYASATFPEDRAMQEEIYADPWNRGYYKVEQQARDGHFWYRMAKHFENPEFLWAAEQVVLGGRPPDGKVPPEYLEAYNRRFAWFNARGIKPRVPGGKSSVGYPS